ncbi:putative nuclease HARBI1 [Trichonephila clavipes]|nr:putative nuclease HARBI1 [Trichonephila clavipes]
MWAKVRSSEWWERIVLQSWDDDDFKEKISEFLGGHFSTFVTGELRTVAHLFGIARCTACIIVREVCTALCNTFKITFPTQRDLDAIATEFFDRSALPGCCGALNGCHIPIKAPSLNAKDYFCRKQFHSLILQAVVDGNSHFMNINVGWPGPVHDAIVFRNSKLYNYYYLAGVTSKLFSPANIVVVVD